MPSIRFFVRSSGFSSSFLAIPSTQASRSEGSSNDSLRWTTGFSNIFAENSQMALLSEACSPMKRTGSPVSRPMKRASTICAWVIPLYS